MNYFNELLSILNAMSPYLLLGFFFAGLLHAYLPKMTYSKHLAGKGFKSVFLSALFGVPLPLCSCGVIPTAMSLKKEGASDGATISFLIATPQTGVDSILATYGVFGLPFAIIRPVIAFVVALFGGTLVNRFSGDKGAATKMNMSTNSATPSSKRATFIGAIKYGFVDVLQDLGGWLTVGLVIAAAITAFVPSTIFELFEEYYILNILVVLLLSIPMYICSTGSIPIALSLMMKGASPGAALIFLMAGPATNVATLTVLRKVLGRRTTLLYLLSIIVGAIAFALFIDFALPAEWFITKLSVVDGSTHCVDGHSWWHTASSILFIMLLINAYILRFFKGRSHSHPTYEVSATQRFLVKDMRCNHCKANVERAITALSGVSSVIVELSSGVVEVEGGVEPAAVCDAVRALGFEVDLL
ncbi:MAG: permease [Rikenellaceae bacterium]